MNHQASDFIQSGLSSLERSIGEHQGDLRNVQVATISPDGRPAVRTVVLRALQRSPAIVEFHADSRSRKTADIARCRQVALLAWSSDEHLQIRLSGEAQLHRADDTARDRWDALSAGARKAYGLRAEPGMPVADPSDHPHLPPDQRFEQFTVVRVALDAIDILQLGPEGSQTRARGRFGPDDITGEWIGP